MSQDFLSSILGQIIVANLTNVRKVTAQTKPDFMKPEKKNKHQMQYNYSSLPVEMQFLKAIKWVQNRLRLLNPLVHSEYEE